MRRALLMALLLPFLADRAGAASNSLPKIAFSRIIHGWTNYSTAFLCTQDTGTASDFATVASPFTPACDVVPVEYAAIFIWSGATNHLPDFSRFSFKVHFWSGLTAFTNSPRTGNVAVVQRPAPTGGSTTVPDAYTRGGRPAWLLRFALTNAGVTLTSHHTYLVGVTVLADSSQAGDLFVPTSSFAGPSDVQAGDLIIGGWRYIVDAGGLTVYSGELATELLIVSAGPAPRLSIARTAEAVRIRWPSGAGCHVLESAGRLGTGTVWQVVTETPALLDGFMTVDLPPDQNSRWFRLALP